MTSSRQNKITFKKLAKFKNAIL